MRKFSLGVLLVGLMLMAVPMGAGAAEKNEKPFQFAFWYPWQVYDKDTSISYFRYNMLYGYNKNVKGVDLGLANMASGDVVGVQLGAVNMVGGNFTGWQSSFANFTDGDFLGLQSGIYNSTKGKCTGAQIGVVNVTGSLYGLQIGLLNFNQSGKPMPFLPVVNFSF